MYPEIPPYSLAPLPIEYLEGPLFCFYGDAVHGHRPDDVCDSYGLAQDTCALSSSSYYLSMTKKRQLPASELGEADDFYSDPHQDSAPTKLKTDGDLPVPRVFPMLSPSMACNNRDPYLPLHNFEIVDRQESLSYLRSVSVWNQKVHQTSLCKSPISWSQRQDRGSSSRNVGRQAKRKQARDAIVLACMKNDPALAGALLLR